MGKFDEVRVEVRGIDREPSKTTFYDRNRDEAVKAAVGKVPDGMEARETSASFRHCPGRPSIAEIRIFVDYKGRKK